MTSSETFGAGSPVVAMPEGVRETASLFDRFGWLYAMLRECCFRDDTEGMEVALWPQGLPPADHCLLEVGCGPGFYSRRFAGKFPHLSVMGVDCSKVQLQMAQRAAQGLANCTFLHANILNIEMEPVDAILAVRLFTVLDRREEALAAIFRLLKPGGRCVIAEPRAGAITNLPLQALWGLARLESLWQQRKRYCEPKQVQTFAPKAFSQMIEEQPWNSVTRWQDKHYQYAICEKSGVSPAVQESGDYVI